MKLGGWAQRTAAGKAQVEVLPAEATKVPQLTTLFSLHFSLSEHVIVALFLELLKGHAEVGRIPNHFKIKMRLSWFFISFLTISEKFGWTAPIGVWIVARTQMGHMPPSTCLIKGLLLDRCIC